MVPHPREELFSVLVVDDHALLREAVISRLTQMGAGTVHEAATVAEARIRATTSGPCDLAIVDLGLPDGSGVALIRELRTHGWRRVVALASSANPYAVRAAFQAGAQAYLLKSSSSLAVADSVRQVMEGGCYTDPHFGAPTTPGNRVPGIDGVPRELSAREIEVLQFVAEGQSNKEIGTELNLSALTVKSHLSRIGRKLGTGDRAQMVALALRAGVIR
jgi:DNA-binding NarL/FixJ family response regulator